MPINRKFFRFKYKLSIIMSLLVVMAVSLLGGIQYANMSQFQNRQYQHEIKLLQQAVVDTYRNADVTSYAVEKELESGMKEISGSILQEYERMGEPYKISLGKYTTGKKYLNVCFINRDKVIDYTSDPMDLDLDFKNADDFSRFLDNVFEKGEFTADRVDISMIKGNLKKFTYQPTQDRKYVIQIGADLNQYTDIFKRADVDFESISQNLKKLSSYICDVNRYSASGVAYGRYDKEGMPLTVADKNLGYIHDAIATHKTITTAGLYDGKPVTYYYIPFDMFEYNRADGTNAIEIVINDWDFRANQVKSKLIIILGIIAACSGAVLIGAIAANLLSKPIEKMTRVINEVSKGNFDCKTDIHTNDEFGLLSRNFDNMLGYVELLLNETAKQADELIDKNTQIKANYLCTVRTLANSLEAKDKYTKGHCERVTEYSLAIGKAMGLNHEELLNLEFAGLLHDIGKIGIPSELINKEGKLTVEEYAIVKKHPEIGYEILKDVAFLEVSKIVLLQHHERVDGKGYPLGLKSEDIHMMAKILAVADSFDAMTSSRPYRLKALSTMEALYELQKNKNMQFDEAVVDVFVGLVSSGAFDQGDCSQAV